MTDEDAVPESTVTRLRMAALRLAQLMRQESGNDADLSPSRFSVLSYVVAGEAVRMGDLARAENVSKSSITRIVARLADQGFVAVVPDPRDGRSTLVTATPAGREVLAATAGQFDAYLGHRLNEFSDLERAALHVAVMAMERLAEPGK
jgi:DNA-binding MarR family transcriptional regulator